MTDDGNVLARVLDEATRERIAAMSAAFACQVRAGMTLPDDAVFQIDLRTGRFDCADRGQYLALSAKCSIEGCPCKWLSAHLVSPAPAGFLHVVFESDRGFIASLLEDPRTKKPPAATFPMYAAPAPKQGGLN